MNVKTIFGGIVAAALLGVTGFGSAGFLAAEEILVERIYDENGEVAYETYVEPSNPLLLKTKHYLRLSALAENEAGPKPGSGSDPGTDCESDSYKTAGWYWTSAVSFVAADYASWIDSGGKTWDSSTGAGIFSGATSGKKGEAGTYDGVNQVEWEHIGESSTVAVTTTWYYRGSGEAVESDAQYNTYYPWATNGDPNSMDVGHVATHEIGHTFGLSHPNGGGISCLTMYAYVDYGQTHGRTLGDGDILGLRAIYGA